MTVLILIKHESTYTKKKIIHTRHSKPDKFGLSIRPYLFIYSNMKYRSSYQYVDENNGHCNIPETDSNDIILTISQRVKNAPSFIEKI